LNEPDSSASTEIEIDSSKLFGYLVIAWLIPGAGHYLLGKRFRAGVFLFLVLALVAIGCSLGGNLHRVLPNEPLTILATIGAMGMGAPYFILRYAVGYAGDVISATYEYGTAFLLTAGLMNLLLILDVMDIGRGKKE
jgi:hypothetical protein